MSLAVYAAVAATALAPLVVVTLLLAHPNPRRHYVADPLHGGEDR